MKRSEAFPSKYLGKEDVPEPVNTTIARVTLAELDEGEEKKTKPTIEFNGLEKFMVLNFTNWTVLEGAYGEDSDGWIGKPVQVYVDPSIMFGTKMVGGLRLRIAQGWTLQEAILEAGKVKITEEEVKEAVRAKGFKGWNSARDTPTIQELIEEAKNPV